MNKKAGEKILSVWWILVLAIIGISIVSSVWIFYGRDINVNKLEAEILSNKVLGCLSNDGKINEDALNKDFNLFEECRLSKDIIDSSYFYINVTVLNSKNEVIKELKFGNPSFEKDCAIKKNAEAKNFPECSSKKIRIFLDYLNDFVYVSIFAGSNNKGQREIIRGAA